jgi:hypothetical protein
MAGIGHKVGNGELLAASESDTRIIGLDASQRGHRKDRNACRCSPNVLKEDSHAEMGPIQREIYSKE